MYQSLKHLILRILRVPPEPDDPMGDARTVRVFRASPNYFRYRLYVWMLKNSLVVLGAAIGAGAVFATFLGMTSSWLGQTGSIISASFAALIAILIATIQLTFSFVTLKLDYEMRWYKVSDRSLRIREGVWIVKEMTMTFANIQNISTTQGPIQRFFKIADVKVESAGGGRLATPDAQNSSGMHVAFFRGVDNAEEIVGVMRNRLKSLKDGGLGDVDDVHEEEEAVAGVQIERHPVSALKLLEMIRDEARLFRQDVETLTELRSVASKS